jgi:hypothetical protein
VVGYRPWAAVDPAICVDGGRCVAGRIRVVPRRGGGAGDQEVVEAFPAQCPDEAFRDRVLICPAFFGPREFG